MLKTGHLGGSVGEASAFSLGHDPGVLGSSPELGFLLNRGGVGICFFLCPSPMLMPSLSQINKFKKSYIKKVVLKTIQTIPKKGRKGKLEQERDRKKQNPKNRKQIIRRRT